MKVELQLQVTQQQVFDLLTKSILSDIEVSTGKTISVDEINGFSYTKSLTTKLGVTNQARIHITSYIAPSTYETKMLANGDEFVCRYDLSTVDGGNCYITYTETYDNPKWWARVNHSIFSKLYVKKSKQRLIGSFRYMEQMILNPELMEKKEEAEVAETTVSDAE